MDRSTHIIDPDGEVMIVLRNANSPFAHPAENMVTSTLSQFLTEHCQKARKSPAESLPEVAAVEDAAVKTQMSESTDSREFRIQVSAKHMMFASSIFKKILTGGWKESETYLKKGSVEVTADGWDLEALLIMIRAIHCQFSLIPKKVTLEMLAKIAAIADYYDCKDVLYTMTDIWFSSLDAKVTAPSRDLVLWLWISWFFKSPTQFAEATSTFMTWSDGFVDIMGLPIPDQVIGKSKHTKSEWC